jgi:tetratricopeptide (TPR) repeat protein
MNKNFTNSSELFEAASSGDLVLFLGAGINVGCDMGDPPKPAPLGNQLANDLSTHFFPQENYSGDSLRSVSTKIQNIEGNEKLNKFLLQRLHPVSISGALKNIPLIRWNSIYTVNIDYGVETAYSDCKDKVQNLVSVVLPDDPTTSDPDLEVPYFKLHGCLMKPESNIIFSHRDYTQAREKNLRLFANLTVTLCQSCLLFIGFGFEDSDFHDLWQSVKDYGGSSSRLKPTFLVKPDPSPSYIKSMGIEGVTVIDADSTTFIPWLKANLDRKPLSIEDRIIERSSAITNWAKEKLSVSLPPSLSDSIKKYCQIVSELDPPVRLPENSSFLLGTSPYWDDIQNYIPIKREIEDEIIEDISSWTHSKKPRISLLLGAAGYGKSTLAMQIAFDISKNNELVVLWIRQNTNFDPTPVSEFCKLIKKPVVVFFDNGPQFMSSIRRLYTDAVSNKFHLYIFIASRPSEWNSARGTNSLPIPSVFRLPRLSEKESLFLAQVLKRSHLLGESMEDLSIEELSSHLVDVGEKHIIAGLRTAMAGKDTKFHEIIAEEFFRIANEKARKIYLSVAISHSLGLHMPATLATRLVDLPLTEYHSGIDKNLEDIVIENVDTYSGDLLFSTQHRVISESLLESVIDPTSTVDLLFQIAKAVNPHSFNEYEILKRIYHEDYLKDVLKEAGRIRSTFEYFMQEFPSDAYIKQHAAIFESQEGNFEKARTLADDAIDLSGNHPHFLNTKGTIWLREAIAERKPDRAEYALKQGVTLIRNRISQDSDKEIHYHSLIDKLLDWATNKPHLEEEQRLRVLEEAQDDLDNALRLYPMSSELVTLLGRLNLGLDKIPEAEEKLKRSIILDGGNIRAILLLTNLLIKKEQYVEALDYLNNGISYAPKSSGLQRLRLKCLIKLPGNWRDIKSAYKEYFKVSPTDYFRRLRFAKSLIENTNFGEATKEIKKVYDAPISFGDKLNLRFNLLDSENRELVVNGIYKAYRLGKGFVELEGYPKSLNAHLDSKVIHSRKVPQSGQSIKVRIGLNGLGIYVKKILQ